MHNIHIDIELAIKHLGGLDLLSFGLYSFLSWLNHFDRSEHFDYLTNITGMEPPSVQELSTVQVLRALQRADRIGTMFFGNSIFIVSITGK